MINTAFMGSQLSMPKALVGATAIRSQGVSAKHICSQSFGGEGKSSRLGACSGELECNRLSPHDRLLLYQSGIDKNDQATTNYIEIARDHEQLTFSFFVEALGGFQASIRRSTGDRRIKLFIKTDQHFEGFYDRIRFMVYDPNYRSQDKQLFVQAYDLPGMQSIDRVGVSLVLAKEQNCHDRLRSDPVGFDQFRTFWDRDSPRILKPNFEWNAGKASAIPGLSIVSNHSECYRSPMTADLRLWKEYVYICL